MKGKLRISRWVFMAVGACLVLAGEGRALDVSQYVPSRHDCLRNGVMLSYGGGGPEARYSVVMPRQHQAVTNIYDFNIYPGQPGGPVIWTWQQAAPYRYTCSPEPEGIFLAEPTDTVCIPYVIQDTSRLDRTIFQHGNLAQIAALVNRIRISASYIPVSNGWLGTRPEVCLLEDINHNCRFDPEDLVLDSGGSVAIVPGERLHILIVVPIPESYRYACADTVSLVCSTERKSPSGQHLTKVVNRVITVQDRSLLQALVFDRPGR